MIGRRVGRGAAGLFVVAVALAAAGAAGGAGGAGAAGAVGAADAAVAVRLVAQDPAAPPLPTPAIGDLADGTVLRLRLSGFAPDTTGSIRQCAYAGGGFQPCRNSYPVRFDAQGWADAQYQLQADVLEASSDCRGAVNPCVVLVEDPAGHSARVITVFSAPVPPAATVTVEPSGELRPGQEVVVSARGLPNGARVYVVACDGAGDCRRASAPVVVRGDGTARLTAEAAHSTFLGVGSDDVDGRAPMVAVSVREVGPPYRLGRTGWALAVAVVLFALAAWLWSRTDWSGPSEAATPEMDAARLE